MPHPARIPVVIISGGLGSGKTTLLNRLLRAGGRHGVVVNDFGAVNIDALLVTGHVDATRAISGSCLCCIADPGELDEALATLADPRLALDSILVEASGIADPRALARMVLASTTPGVRFGGVVHVVDATAELAPDHVRVASLLVVNKCDLADPAPLVARLRELAPNAPVVEAVEAAVAPELVVDVGERDDDPEQLSLAALYDDGAVHAHHESVSLEVDGPVHPHRLFELLEAPLPGVSRLKGVVHVGPPDAAGRFVVQRVGSWVGVERGRWEAGETPRTSLVAIGVGIDREELAAALRARCDGRTTRRCGATTCSACAALRRPRGADAVPGGRRAGRGTAPIESIGAGWCAPGT